MFKLKIQEKYNRSHWTKQIVQCPQNSILLDIKSFFSSVVRLDCLIFFSFLILNNNCSRSEYMHGWTADRGNVYYWTRYSLAARKMDLYRSLLEVIRETIIVSRVNFSHGPRLEVIDNFWERIKLLLWFQLYIEWAQLCQIDRGKS